MSIHRQMDTVKRTVIARLEAPRWKSIATSHFIEFKQRRDLYEKQQLEKWKQTYKAITSTFYKTICEG